ncbi:MAG: hypothetical protein O2782_10640 [bacterium]|nr:hypothetical protein [bacterium]
MQIPKLPPSLSELWREVSGDPDPDPGPSEWTILSTLCGTPWKQSRDGYWPPDSRQPDAWSRSR